MQYKTQFIKNLKDYRKQHNLTQDDLAEMLGYSQKNIAKWEQGFSLPPVEVVIELSKKMHMSLDNLFGLNEKTIYEKCVDYVIEIQDLDKNEQITLREEIGIDEFEETICTVKELVESNVFNVFLRFYLSIEGKQCCKKKLDSFLNGKSKNYTLILEYLKNNGHVEEKDGEYILSYDFAMECFDQAEETGEIFYNPEIKKEYLTKK